MDGSESANMMSHAQSRVQEGANAFVQSQQAWLEGIQDMSKNLAEMAQSNMSRAMSNWLALTGVKSLPDVMELQKHHTITAMSELMSSSAKLTSASMNLCQRAMAPINAQVTHTMAKITTPTV